MAKTRSQSRRNNEISSQTSSTRSNNIKKSKVKTKEFKVPLEMKTCRVRLLKLNQNQINLLMNGVNAEKTIKTEEKQPLKKYDFRARPDVPVIATEKSKKSLQQIVALSQSALYTSKAIRIWDCVTKEAKKNNVEIRVNQIVCGRMSSHRPWPAKLESFQKNGVLLKFFGTHELGIVKKSEIMPYESCVKVLEEYLKVPTGELASKTLSYHMSFVKACREVACIQQ